MAVRRKADKFFVDFMLGGQRYREFGFDTELAGHAWEASARLELSLGKPLPPGPVSTKVSKTTIMDHVRHCAKVHWSGHKSAFKSIRMAEQFAEWVGTDVALSEALTSANCADYVSYLMDEECSGGTINRRLAAVSVLAKLAKIDVDLLWQKEGQGRLRWFSDAEEDQILQTLKLWGEDDERRLFIFLADTGARLGEALKLEWRDINRENRTVSFWETKGGTDRTLVLTKRALEAVTWDYGLNRPGPFTGINRWTLRSLWARLRTHLPFLEDAVIHTYRHTCASRLAQRGVELIKIKDWMGHKAIQTTLRYAHLSPKNTAEVAAVLER